MTPERKAEVNRLLAELDGWSFCRTGPGDDGFWQKCSDSSIGKCYNLPDYTADLNALARLEKNLPRHWWQIDLTGDLPDIQASLHIRFSLSFFEFGPTEAEARAEAIAKYLKWSKDQTRVQPE